MIATSCSRAQRMARSGEIAEIRSWQNGSRLWRRDALGWRLKSPLRKAPLRKAIHAAAGSTTSGCWLFSRFFLNLLMMGFSSTISGSTTASGVRICCRARKPANVAR